MNTAHEQKIYESLKSLGVIPEDKLDSAFKQSQSSDLSFYSALVDKDLITDENFGTIAADVLGVSYINLEEINITSETLHVIPEIVARKKYAISFEQSQEGIKVAMSDPSNQEFLDFVSKKTGDPVVPFYATERNIEGAFSYYNKDLKTSFEELMKKHSESKDAPISKIVDMLIKYAYQNKSSDLHIEPEETISVIRFRIDGVLHDVLSIPKEMHEQIISRIKVLSQLRTDERLKPQDGRMQIELELENLDIRVSIVPIVEGEKCVLRLLSSRSRRFSLQDLGMDEKTLDKIKKGYKNPHGMVLATGPTGSGKTTTIYSILKIINSRDVNIATIEDPVEYDVAGVNQIQVNNKTNLTFANGLRSILRQDPDIVFVGEIRDEETASIAVNSAMTGHLVLSTLHTNDAATTLPRLIDMDIEPYLVASTVNVIVAQRLVRKICDHCKVSYNIKKTKLKKALPEKIIKKYFGSKNDITFYKGKGCEICHGSGYVGRVGVFEVLNVSPTIKKLITNKASAAEINEAAIKEGMKSMYEDGLDKVSKGITTLDEVFRVAKE